MTDKKYRKIIVRPGGGRDYPIIIGSGAIDSLRGAIGVISTRCRVLIVTDGNVAAHYLEKTEKAVRSKGTEPHSIVLRPGEKNKNFNTYKSIIEKLAELDGAGDLVIALGGGVVGDLGGFAAASYRRGIPLIQVPTSLLACVDSSVGGKTGFDLPAGKNLVGAFYQPRSVVIDTDMLSTLPVRELRAGMAEVIKYGFIMDEPFIRQLRKNMPALYALDSIQVSRAIERCCRLKAKVVAADERDTKDVRAILNFGHTFAHAIETACGYRRYNHGEAVAIGMACAADLSAKLGIISADDARAVEALITEAQLPVNIEVATARRIFDLMAHDKKTRGGKIRLVLLEKTGKAVVRDAPPAGIVLGILKKRIV